jgi:hypothetical protein
MGRIFSETAYRCLDEPSVSDFNRNEISELSLTLFTRYNMEKVAYNLLQRHSSNYWREQDDGGDVKRTPRQRRRPITLCGPPTSIKSPLCRNADNEIDRVLPPPSPGVQRRRWAIQRKHVNLDVLQRPLQPVAIQRESSTRYESR